MKAAILATLLPGLWAQAYTHANGTFHERGPGLLNSQNLYPLGSHGCWCSRLNKNGNIGINVIDEVDRLCQQWLRARRCLVLKGGACKNHRENDYTSTDMNDATNCVGTAQASTDCGHDSCEVDSYYLQALQTEMGLNFVPTISTVTDCTLPLLAEKKYLSCHGSAPALELLEDNWRITLDDKYAASVSSGWVHVQLKLKNIQSNVETWTTVYDDFLNASKFEDINPLTQSNSGYIDENVYELLQVRVQTGSVSGTNEAGAISGWGPTYPRKDIYMNFFAFGKQWTYNNMEAFWVIGNPFWGTAVYRCTNLTTTGCPEEKCQGHNRWCNLA